MPFPDTYVSSAPIEIDVLAPQGPRGKSAYEDYLDTTEDDPVLTEEQWLASLAGPQGDTGPQGDVGPAGPAGTTDYNDLDNKPVAGVDFAPAYPRAINYSYNNDTAGTILIDAATPEQNSKPRYYSSSTRYCYWAIPELPELPYWEIRTGGTKKFRSEEDVASPDLVVAWVQISGTADTIEVESADITTAESVQAAGGAMAADLGTAAALDASEGGNGAADAGKVVKFGSGGTIGASQSIGCIFNGVESAIGSTGTNGNIQLGIKVGVDVFNAGIQPNLSQTDDETFYLPLTGGTLAKTSDIPTVYSWAQAATKPSYTASEVGAVGLTGDETIAGAKTWSGQQEFTGQALLSGTSGVNRDLGDGRYSRRLYERLVADHVGITNSTALVDIGLSLDLPVGEWLVESDLYMVATTAAAGGKASINISSACRVDGVCYYGEANNAGVARQNVTHATVTDFAGGSWATAQTNFRFVFTIIVTSPVTLKLQAAQGAATAGHTTVPKTGAYITASQLPV